MAQISVKKRTVILGLFGIVATVATLATTFNFSTKSANAASWCECTQYVRNRFGLSTTFPNAKDWNDGYLQNNGFVKINAKVGSIVVMESSFPGADPTYGHVAVVESIDSYGRITVRGANQSVGTAFVTESDCTNVRSTQFATSINGRSDISFWEKGTTPVSGLKTLFIDNFALNTNNYFVKFDTMPVMSSWTKSSNYSDPDQQFTIKQLPSGNYWLQHKSTGGCLNAHYINNQMNVWTPCDANDPDQNWVFPNMSNGSFQIKKANTNYCVEMPYRTDGGRIQLSQCNSSSNQSWRTN